jgi:hypothetical protein
MKIGWLNYKNDHVLLSYMYSFIILLIWLYLYFIWCVDNFFKRLNFEIYWIDISLDIPPWINCGSQDLSRFEEEEEEEEEEEFLF